MPARPPPMTVTSIAFSGICIELMHQHTGVCAVLASLHLLVEVEVRANGALECDCEPQDLIRGKKEVERLDCPSPPHRAHRGPAPVVAVCRHPAADSYIANALGSRYRNRRAVATRAA